MALSLTEELRRTFDRSMLKKEAAEIRTPGQWQRARALQHRCERTVQKEERLYRQNYDTRVELALRRILNQAGKKIRDHQPAWAARDRFSREDAQRQAHREVRAAHHARLEKIQNFEARELRKIVKQSMRENNLRGAARTSFTQATNRRSGQDRRKGPSR